MSRNYKKICCQPNCCPPTCCEPCCKPRCCNNNLYYNTDIGTLGNNAIFNNPNNQNNQNIGCINCFPPNPFRNVASVIPFSFSGPINTALVGTSFSIGFGSGSLITPFVPGNLSAGQIYFRSPRAGIIRNLWASIQSSVALPQGTSVSFTIFTAPVTSAPPVFSPTLLNVGPLVINLIGSTFLSGGNTNNNVPVNPGDYISLVVTVNGISFVGSIATIAGGLEIL